MLLQLPSTSCFITYVDISCFTAASVDEPIPILREPSNRSDNAPSVDHLGTCHISIIWPPEKVPRFDLA